ncbi:MAG: ferritin family protein [Bacteriovoracaceae bacterium]|nr:ferritin family protein [Bacteriovoracaceae bacterium]
MFEQVHGSSDQNNLEFDDIIEMAIIEEENSYQTYRELAEKIEDKHAKELLHLLATEENEHICFLEQFYGEGPREFNVGQNAPADNLAHLKANDVLVDTSINNLLMYALNKEHESYLFYNKMAKRSTKPEARDTFIKLARLELTHIQKLQKLCPAYIGHSFLSEDAVLTN